MLFEILTVILAIYVMAVPFMMLKFIKFGMLAAEKPEETAAKPTFKLKIPVKIPRIRKKTRMTDREKQILESARILDRNIDAYDGTGTGQEEIKHGFN